ncbi:Hypothetical_protein [Hexamita inflata]|uniref:Hypothetical_protein n=1 Tax=Hexamita inflata TaxID=28002 RepID=A0AA86PPW9_9EUKA|nr:Hypothetical protein HINF_LOCUS31639 [Hexamita inflata]
MTQQFIKFSINYVTITYHKINTRFILLFSFLQQFFKILKIIINNYNQQQSFFNISVQRKKTSPQITSNNQVTNNQQDKVLYEPRFLRRRSWNEPSYSYDFYALTYTCFDFGAVYNFILLQTLDLAQEIHFKFSQYTIKQSPTEFSQDLKILSQYLKQYQQKLKQNQNSNINTYLNDLKVLIEAQNFINKTQQRRETVGIKLERSLKDLQENEHRKREIEKREIRRIRIGDTVLELGN